MFVDVSFGISAVASTAIPADHGYVLYGAVTTVLPGLHGSSANVPAFAIHPIQGAHAPGRELVLTSASALTVRIRHDHVGTLLPLAGKALRLGPQTVRVGVPTTRPLVPAPVLHARLVTIKGFTEPVPFLDAVRRQLSHAGIEASADLLARTAGSRLERRSPGSDGPVRRTLRVGGKEIVGFAVRVAGLTPEASLALQASGVGGRQHFGCGVLVPVRADLAGFTCPAWAAPVLDSPP